MQKAIFFDRDGIINKTVLRNGKPCSPRTLEEFIILEEAKETVKILKDAGYKIVIITNQPDIARGLMRVEDLRKMHNITKEILCPDRILYCPHDDTDNCKCRKPKPGMIIKAATELNINLNKSFVIGDTWKDIKAGKAAGCKTFLVNTPYNKEVKSDYRIKNLKEAIEIIKELS